MHADCLWDSGQIWQEEEQHQEQQVLRGTGTPWWQYKLDMTFGQV